MADLSSFMEEESVGWGSRVEVERRNRIRLSVAAYAYEYLNTSIMSDGEFDELCGKINVQINTGNDKLDTFFREHFEPHTGMWICKHPEKHKLSWLVGRYH